MSAIYDAVILGPIMVLFVSGWFLWMPVLFRDPKPAREGASAEVSALRRRDREDASSAGEADAQRRAA